MAETEVKTSDVLEITVKIVSAFVSNNAMPSERLPSFISTVHSAVLDCCKGTPLKGVARTPAVSIKKSVQPEYLICLEDGKKLKMLKRYLRTKYDMSPDEYRRKWGLPDSYPMVAPNYSKRRSQFAKEIGLGRSKTKAARRTGSRKITKKTDTRKKVA